MEISRHLGNWSLSCYEKWLMRVFSPLSLSRVIAAAENPSSTVNTGAQLAESGIPATRLLSPTHLPLLIGYISWKRDVWL